MLLTLLPFGFVLVLGLFFMLVSHLKVFSKTLGIWLNIGGLFVVLGLFLLAYSGFGEFNKGTFLKGFIYLDTFSFVMSFGLVALYIVFLFSTLYTKDSRFYKTEILSLSNLSLFGMMIMTLAAEFITMLIALEIASIGIYALIAVNNSKNKNIEAALKYFLLSAFVGAFYLLGVALIFGITNSTKFADVASYFASNSPDFLAVLALVFVFVALFFKIGIFGFYNWILDVYYGANTNVSGLLTSAFKISAFAMFVRIVFVGFENLSIYTQDILYPMAVLTMFVGNFLSVKEENIKRLLIASSIVHSGYILVAFASVQSFDINALSGGLFYLIAYSLTIGATFMILNGLFSSNKDLEIKNLRGLYKSYPIESFMIVIFSLSFIGFPYTVGFFGKLYIFATAIENHKTPLAVFAVINTIISVYYYLKIIINIYFFKEDKHKIAHSSFALKLVSVLIAGFVIAGGFGLYTIDTLQFIFAF